jgi:adenine C2-methylase RlmN of 23S rRNA A2503 and tRNA A37
MRMYRWLYQDGNWIRKIEDASVCQKQNGFGQSFLDKVAGRVTCAGGLHLQSVHKAADGTQKLLFSAENSSPGDALVETVLIPVVRAQGTKKRVTICVSCQVHPPLPMATS